MQTKVVSCERCIKNNPSLIPKQQIYQSEKKPEEYLAKKFQQLYHEDRKLRQKKSKKIQQYHTQRQQEQLNYCTFQPKVNSNQEFFVSNSSFLKRQIEWKSSIEKKIAAKRQLEQNNNKKKYTFQPKISSFPHSTLGKQKKQKNVQYSKPTQNRSSNLQKSYKNIYTDRKKMKQMTKSVFVQPFPHRIYNSTMQNSHNYDSITLSKTMTTIQHSVSQSPLKKQKNMLIVDDSERTERKNPEDSRLSFQKELTIKKVIQYDLTESKDSNFSSQIQSPVKHLPHSTKKTLLKFNSTSSVEGQKQVLETQVVDQQLHKLAKEQSLDEKLEKEVEEDEESEQDEIF